MKKWNIQYLFKRALIVLILSSFTIAAKAQLKAILPYSAGYCPGTIALPISVSNLTNVGSFTLTFFYPQNYLTYNSFQNIHGKLNSGTYSVNAQNGKIIFTWTAAYPVTLYNSPLVEIVFTGINSYFTMAWDTLTPGACQFISFNQDTLPSTFEDGYITLSSSYCGKLKGLVSYKNSANTPLVNTEVFLKYPWGDNRYQTTTDSTGHYEFKNISTGQYVVNCYVTKPWGGCTGTDALMMMKHFAGLYTLNGVNLKSADVNASGFVNADDALLGIRRYVGITDGFAAGDWKVDTKNVDITPSTNDTVDIHVLCTGDANGSFFPDTCTPWPSTPDAGPRQSLLTPITHLQGNTPVYGTGNWTLLSGPGGNIAQPDNPNSVFTGIPGNSYVLRWTINTNCASISDTVRIDMHIANVPCPALASFSYGGQVYNTVQIASQCWIRENLNIGTQIDATLEQSNNAIIEKYCYDNNPVNCEVYGGLYKWDEMMQYVTDSAATGICPQGFHIPTDYDWRLLEGILGNSAVGKMKETGYIHWMSPNVGATNETGFTALGAGVRSPYTLGFGAITIYGEFWTSSGVGTGTAWYRLMSFDAAFVWRQLAPRDLAGLSVRCVKYL